MTDLLFPVPAPVLAATTVGVAFAVRRLFCVGRNYAEHAREMGGDERAAPFFFMKGPDAVVPGGAAVPYPPGTSDWHHEVELVVAIGSEGFNVSQAEAPALVWGYGVGLDMTRRDLQAVAKSKRRPWDVAKNVPGSAPLGPLAPAAQVGAMVRGAITLDVNGARRQTGDLAQMIWSVPEVVAHLSALYRLMPGDLIMTGTPAGVGAVVAGDQMAARIEGLAPLDIAVGPAE